MIKSYIPSYKTPPNKFIRYEYVDWHDGRGHGGRDLVAHFTNKNGKHCRTTAQVVHNFNYKELWKSIRSRLDIAGYMLHYPVHIPMEGFEVIKPDESGTYHLVYISFDEVKDMILEYSVYQGWANYSIVDGEYIETRSALENAVGIKKIMKFR